jgi:hypothetical protein
MELFNKINGKMMLLDNSHKSGRKIKQELQMTYAEWCEVVDPANIILCSKAENLPSYKILILNEYTRLPLLPLCHPLKVLAVQQLIISSEVTL